MRVSHRTRVAARIAIALATPFIAYSIVRGRPMGVVMDPLLGTYYVTVIVCWMLLGFEAGLTALWTGGCLLRAAVTPREAVGAIVLFVALGVGLPVILWRLRREH